MKKFLNIRFIGTGLVLATALMFTGCSKDAMQTTAGDEVKDISGKKIALTASQERAVQDLYTKMPKLKYWDATNHRFIEMKGDGSRDLVFSDPDEGFTFDDGDGDGAMIIDDGDGSVLIFSSGFGVAGTGGGGGMVVAGSTVLEIDIAYCMSVEEVGGEDSDADLFDSGLGFDQFSAVIGIAGDFEGLANDPETEDPFQYIYGFAAYYVIGNGDLSGSHNVFDLLGSEGDEDFDDFATAFVVDLQNFALGFASGGTIEISEGSMSFNGTYLMIDGEDLFDSFLSDGDSDFDVSEVTGYGTMGCN